MAFYENTIIARQDLAEKEIKSIVSKYKDLIKSIILKKVFLFIISLSEIKIPWMK